MSGHSKWATIKRQKAITDQKRGQAFTKLGKMIALAAKNGADPETNFKLRMIIEKAKYANMPKVNIERILERVKKGAEEANVQEILFEGFTGDGVAVLVEAATDNLNRTVSEVRSLFSKNGDNLGERGSVSHLFEQVGSIVAVKGTQSAEEVILTLMDIDGVEDIEEVADAYEIYTKMDKLHAAKLAIEAKGLTIIEAEIIWKPKILVSVSDKEKVQKLFNFFEILEEVEDVQKVYSNLDIAEDLFNDDNSGN